MPSCCKRPTRPSGTLGRAAVHAWHLTESIWRLASILMPSCCKLPTRPSVTPGKSAVLTWQLAVHSPAICQAAASCPLGHPALQVEQMWQLTQYTDSQVLTLQSPVLFWNRLFLSETGCSSLKQAFPLWIKLFLLEKAGSSLKQAVPLLKTDCYSLKQSVPLWTGCSFLKLAVPLWNWLFQTKASCSSGYSVNTFNLSVLYIKNVSVLSFPCLSYNLGGSRRMPSSPPSRPSSACSTISGSDSWVSCCTYSLLLFY